MNGLDIYEDMDRWDEVFGDLDLTMLHHGELHRVFVYGTLKSGMRNHHRLLREGARLLSTDARTCMDHDWLMFSKCCGGCSYTAPVVVEGRPGYPKGTVYGEVYEVDNAILMDLDRFEGHPEVYKRREVMIHYRWDGKESQLPTWMYVYQGEPTGKTRGIQTEHQGTGFASYKWTGIL